MIVSIQHVSTLEGLAGLSIIYGDMGTTNQVKLHITIVDSRHYPRVTSDIRSPVPMVTCSSSLSHHTGAPVIIHTPETERTCPEVGMLGDGIGIDIQLPSLGFADTATQIGPERIGNEFGTEIIHLEFCVRSPEETATGFNTDTCLISTIERNLQTHLILLETALRCIKDHRIARWQQTLELDDIRIAFVVRNREGDVLSQILRRQVLIAQTKLVWRAARHEENHDCCQKRIYFIYNLHKTNTLKS